MKNLIPIFLFVALFSGHSLYAQVKYMKDVKETEEMSIKVTKLFQQKRYSDAISELAAYWPLPYNEIDGLQEKTVKYMGLLNERFGEPVGMVKIRSEKLADVAIRETYLVRYENTAIRLKFTYYRSSQGGIVNSFKWDDSFEEEFSDN